MYFFITNADVLKNSPMGKVSFNLSKLGPDSNENNNDKEITDVFIKGKLLGIFLLLKG